MIALDQRYLCEACGAAFDEPYLLRYREDMNGEGAFQRFCFACCPECGSDTIRERREEEEEEE